MAILTLTEGYSGPGPVLWTLHEFTQLTLLTSLWVGHLNEYKI